MASSSRSFLIFHLIVVPKVSCQFLKQKSYVSSALREKGIFLQILDAQLVDLDLL